MFRSPWSGVGLVVIAGRDTGEHPRPAARFRQAREIEASRGRKRRGIEPSNLALKLAAWAAGEGTSLVVTNHAAA